jgi:hypothetical protein
VLPPKHHDNAVWGQVGLEHCLGKLCNSSYWVPGSNGAAETPAGLCCGQSRGRTVQLGAPIDATEYPSWRCNDSRSHNPCYLPAASPAKSARYIYILNATSFGCNHCRDLQRDTCPNSCSGRGTCKQGFCHCDLGYFGRDCSRSRAYHPPLLGPDHPVPYGQLKIYMYELPWQVGWVCPA